jgi:hypothetical protein
MNQGGDRGFSNGWRGRCLHVNSPEITLQPGQDILDVAGNTGLTARCPNGTRVVGTGFNGSEPRQHDLRRTRPAAAPA